mgnify:CR=1 FL=1
MHEVRRLRLSSSVEEDIYVALCPEVDVVSQGPTIEEARNNLIEALTLFFEHAEHKEVQSRLHNEVLVTNVDIPVRLK